MAKTQNCSALQRHRQPHFLTGPCAPAWPRSAGSIQGAGEAGKLGSNTGKGTPLRSRRGGRASWSREQRLATAATEEAGDPFGLLPRGVEVPQPHFPLRAPGREPEGVQGAPAGPAHPRTRPPELGRNGLGKAVGPLTPTRAGTVELQGRCMEDSAPRLRARASRVRAGGRGRRGRS